MKKVILFFSCVCLNVVVLAQEVNFAEHIAPIIYNQCTSCHRPGEVAPFSLTNYEEVKSWAPMIRYVTSIRYMPPWKPDHTFQNYQGENYLTDEQIKKISDWVAQGTPRGNPALEPILPVFPEGSQVGTPDLVISFSQSYTHKGNNLDEYRYFVLPTGLTEDKNLVGLEMRPGNPGIVHHALAWADTTGYARASDAATPEYGYERDSMIRNSVNGQLPGYVPGSRPILYTHGIAQRLTAGSDIKIQMHYAPSPIDQQDSTTINLFFAKEPAKRFVESFVMTPMARSLTNGPFFIPANQIREFHGTYQFTKKVSLLNIFPHMHRLGQRWEVFAVTPENDTINLIRINEWDFDWQGTYSFKKPIILPERTVIHAFAKYDNTENNPENPNSPPKMVTWGEDTDDEMFYLPFSWVSYEPGDENMNFENQTTGVGQTEFYSIQNELYPIAPNPARNQVKIGFTLAEAGNLNLDLFDINGKLVRTLVTNRFYLQGLHTFDLDISNQATGMYIVTLSIKGKQYSQKLMIF